MGVILVKWGAGGAGNKCLYSSVVDCQSCKLWVQSPVEAQVLQTNNPTPYALPGCCRRSYPTAAPECANRHAKVIAGAAIPNAERQFGRAD
jgi:hypothetical protein